MENNRNRPDGNSAIKEDRRPECVQQETVSVGVLAKERASPMPSIHDMMPDSGHIDSQSSGHAGAFNRAQREMSII